MPRKYNTAECRQGVEWAELISGSALETELIRELTSQWLHRGETKPVQLSPAAHQAITQRFRSGKHSDGVAFDTAMLYLAWKHKIAVPDHRHDQIGLDSLDRLACPECRDRKKDKRSYLHYRGCSNVYKALFGATGNNWHHHWALRYMAHEVEAGSTAGTLGGSIGDRVGVDNTPTTAGGSNMPRLTTVNITPKVPVRMNGLHGVANREVADSRAAKYAVCDTWGVVSRWQLRLWDEQDGSPLRLIGGQGRTDAGRLRLKKGLESSVALPALVYDRSDVPGAPPIGKTNPALRKWLQEMVHGDNKGGGENIKDWAQVRDADHLWGSNSGAFGITYGGGLGQDKCPTLEVAVRAFALARRVNRMGREPTDRPGVAELRSAWMDATRDDVLRTLNWYSWWMKEVIDPIVAITRLGKTNPWRLAVASFPVAVAFDPANGLPENPYLLRAHVPKERAMLGAPGRLLATNFPSLTTGQVKDVWGKLMVEVNAHKKSGAVLINGRRF